MAVHGHLIAGSRKAAVQGYLASVRDLRLRTPRLDRIDGDLIVQAERLIGDGRGATYRFALVSEDAELLSGRATVLLDPAA